MTSGRTMLLGVLGLLAVIGHARSEEEAMSALDLTEDTFADKVSAGPHFVMFFAPWCGHCKRLAPVWEELAVKHNKKDEVEVTIGKVDCTQQTALCSAQDVTGYPTLKFFKNGAEKDDGVKHRGNRDMASLDKFIQEQLGNEVEEEKPAEAASGEATVENGLHILTASSFANTVAKGDTFIKFYAPWCGYCQKLAPVWDELAKMYEKDEKVKIAKVDCTQHQSVCQENEVRGYPTLHYFRDGSKLETYKGARATKELKDFVEETKGSAGGAKEEDGKVPQGTPEEATNVLVLDSTNFDEGIDNNIVFVKFYAPWCGHCKRLAPTWDELGDKFKDLKTVNVAKVDCTDEDKNNRKICEAQGVNGFPTLNIYKKGKMVEEYNGKRGLEDLVQFVEKHMAVKDEL